jgi:hypothetical protein
MHRMSPDIQAGHANTARDSMQAKNRDYQLTGELLREYRDAALVNAQALLEEAALLLAHGHHARAYFLAASCIEEAGKAVQAFEGLGRNLEDSAVMQSKRAMNHVLEGGAAV